MRLNLSTIKEMTSGAVRIEENENGINFYRFTKQQEDFYEKRKALLTSKIRQLLG